MNCNAQIVSHRLTLSSSPRFFLSHSPSLVRLFLVACREQYERPWFVVFRKPTHILNMNNPSKHTDVYVHEGLKARHDFGTSYTWVYGYLVKSVLTQIHSYCRALTANVEMNLYKTTCEQQQTFWCYFWATLRTNVQIPRDTMLMMTSHTITKEFFFVQNIQNLNI